LKDEK
jgi:cell division FtsZ-interacting protein ZapD